MYIISSYTIVIDVSVRDSDESIKCKTRHERITIFENSMGVHDNKLYVLISHL